MARARPSNPTQSVSDMGSQNPKACTQAPHGTCRTGTCCFPSPMPCTNPPTTRSSSSLTSTSSRFGTASTTLFARQPGDVFCRWCGMTRVGTRVRTKPPPGMEAPARVRAMITANSRPLSAHRRSKGLSTATARISAPYSEAGMLLPTRYVCRRIQSLKKQKPQTNAAPNRPRMTLRRVIRHRSPPAAPSVRRAWSAATRD